MLAYIRYTAGLGSTAIYARLRNATGQFWDFVGLVWVGTETADCKINMTERDDSDTVDSLYAINLSMPSGGPWIQEAVLASSGGVLGFDTTAMDAKASDILTESQSHPTLAEIEATTVLAKEATLTAMKGATFNGATDSLEALRDRGDTAWITATGFSTHSAADAWAVATRTLTAGTNIVLVKGTGVTGFNDLSAAQVNTECDTALTDYDPPTRTEATADKDAIVAEVNANETALTTHEANRATMQTTLVAEHDATQALINEKVSGNTQINIVSATKGSIQVSYAKSGGTIEIVKGDTISIPYGPLAKDITGRKVYFGVKQLLSDTAYAIAVKEITSSVTSFSTFTGTIPLTSAETGLAAGNYYAEIESRGSDGTSVPVTELKFILKVVDQVIV